MVSGHLITSLYIVNFIVLSRRVGRDFYLRFMGICGIVISAVFKEKTEEVFKIKTISFTHKSHARKTISRNAFIMCVVKY